MKINLIAVGKLQTDYKKLFNDYVKKLNFYVTLNIVEVKEVNHDNIATQKQKETELILKAIPKNSKVFLLATNGPQYNSNEFANLINEDNITFVIGGSHGVVEEKFTSKINFSKMTFPHQLFRVIFAEQLFRAFTIKNNTKYHK